MRRSVLLYLTALLLTSTLACSLVKGLIPSPAQPALPTASQGPAILLPTAESTSPPGLPAETTPSASGDGLPISPEALAKMEEIEQQVITLRGLYPNRPSDRTLLSPDQLRQRVLDDFLGDYSLEEARDDTQVLALLGLLPADFELLDFYIELYSEQVAGYYDDEVKRMFVVGGEGFGGPERLTHAHEFVHALQDQNYDFQGKMNFTDDACEADSERCAGIRSLVEGDASLLEEQWARTYAAEQDIEEIIAFYDNLHTPVYDRAPEFMKQDFIFPYVQGSEFVRSLYLEGRWAGVDAAYQDLPLSTEQILHPDRYPEDKPRRLDLPDLTQALGEGWREIDLNNLGEWYMRLTLMELLPEETAVKAAEGWGGDTYRAYHNDQTGDSALVLVSSWDRMADAEEFFLALRDYGDQRIGRHEGDAKQLRWQSSDEGMLAERSSDQVLWILAPDADSLEDLRQAVAFPAKRE
ncbi:MAG: hypothetical protein MUO23_11585 [Anaerolineales bacterium]|nr:hypothetical protein [Anaerolineales bacterium]